MNMVRFNLYIRQYCSFTYFLSLLCCIAYYAQVAGLHYGVSLSDNGFEVSLAFSSFTPHAFACLLR